MNHRRLNLSRSCTTSLYTAIRSLLETLFWSIQISSISECRSDERLSCMILKLMLVRNEPLFVAELMDVVWEPEARDVTSPALV
ncbi:hypothetical protein DPMN_074599 [Dreissena polymorpha]|uniref:Uncharacterized protein n=1 Tax=Dreissena polymorpha TaxID=45954 RepID=A0A9D3YIY4_DREPO|nr:hypothetical protein DPMN_074599 [Dreissena polymorpha]